MLKHKYIYLIFSLLLVVITFGIFSLNNNLRIIACDVGQGDATLLIKSDKEILIDAGPDASVVKCLSEYMPFWDREVEVAFLTHPEKDHFIGFLEVFKKYKVKNFIATELDSGTPEYQLLETLVGGGYTKVINGVSGSDVRLGLIHLDILFPENVFVVKNSELENEKNILGKRKANLITLNSYSINILMSFGKFNAFFAGDANPETQEILLKNSAIKKVEYLKVPHHGSKKGLTEKFLAVLKPNLSIISVGAKNTYGHPHKEILDMLKKYNSKILRTDELGDIIIETDGTRYWTYKGH